jgi:putative hemin transport protein
MEMPEIRKASNPIELARRWAELKNAEPKLRVRDAADRLGVREAELVATGCLEGKAIRLDVEMATLIKRMPDLGEVMALTRNDSVVHEKVGRYDKIDINPHVGIVLNEEIDLRLFPKHWHHFFAVSEPVQDGVRRSIQCFDAAGDAVHKVYLRPESSVDAFERLVAEFRAEDQSGVLALRERAPKPADLPDAEIDVAGFRAAWKALDDTHNFFGLLKKFKVGRLQALRLAGTDLAERVSAGALRFALEKAAERRLPIMVFVGNEGCIQIHSGPVSRTAAMGPWFNVLDPGFNLHIREDHIDQAWVVRKPTVDGIVTSLEIFDKDKQLILTMFGLRKPGIPEDEGWRTLVAEFPKRELETAR